MTETETEEAVLSIVRARLEAAEDMERVAVNVFLDPTTKAKFDRIRKQTGWTQREVIEVGVDVLAAVLPKITRGGA